MDFVFLRRHPVRLHSLCILQGGPRIFFKGAKVFHIPPPPPHVIQNFFDILHLAQKKKLQPPPPVLMMKVKYGHYDEMVQRNV